jgi:thymidylate kinase
MLIILEGPDLAGKSTIAGQLITQLATRYPRHSTQLLHRSPPTSHPLDEYVTPLLEYDPRGTQNIVCDRWHLGEIVYPKIKNRASSMSPAILSYVQMFLESRGAMIAIINPSESNLVKRLAERGDDHVTESELAAIHRRFAEMAGDPDVWFERYFTFQPTVDTLLYSATGCGKRVPPGRYVTYVGPQAPSVLLVGDDRNCRGGDACTHAKVGRTDGRPTHSPRGPAFMPYPATSGEFLMRSITGLRWHTFVPLLGLANACDVDDIMSLWRDLYRPRVVALGVNAAARLDEVGIQHGSVPHPQFVRRFHYRSAFSYGQKILDVAASGEDAISWRPR